MSPDLVSAFEGSMVEVEFLAKKKVGKAFACVLAHFLYRTRPSMSYQQEGYQRGPIHVGNMRMNLRAYAWTKQEVEKFIEFRDKEDLELLKSISSSVQTAMDALGGELEKYLKIAGEIVENKKEEDTKPKTPSMAKRLRAELLGPPKAKKQSEEKKTVE